MGIKHEKEFYNQLKRNRQTTINEFLSREDLCFYKATYCHNFDTIKQMIEKLGAKASIECIENIIMRRRVPEDDFLLFRDVNNAILDGDLTQDMLT